MDRQRLADALAYEQERRRRLANVVPMPASGQPEVAPTPSLRSNLENLSIGLGEGLTNQLEGVRALVTDPIGSAKGAYEGVVAAVRDPSIIADALRYTAQQAASGPLGAGEVIGEMVGPMRTRGTPVMQEIDVYHGSPHRFEEFDASKIGTGEGAQAYGHGIYFAENPKVAAGYRSQLAPGSIRTIDGGDYDSANPEHIAAKYLNTFQKKNYSPQKIANILEEDANITGEEKYKTAAEILRSGNIEKLGKLGHRPSGALYTADLPDEMVDRMLDWDKPLSEQPKAVREHVMRYMNVKEGGLPADMSVIDSGGGKYVVAQEIPPLPGSTFGIPRTITKGPRANSPEAAIKAYWDNLKGEDFYKTLAGDVGEGAAASEYLRSLGIPGIKYLDAGSRGQGGSGTRNFVVFPGEEKKVTILSRE